MPAQSEICQLLCALGVVDPAAVEPYYPRVRDRDDIPVLRCRRSGVIFLSRTDHIGQEHYEAKVDARNQVELGGRPVPTPLLNDAARRAADFGALIRGRRWLDVGTGTGDILDVLAPQAACAVGVEPAESDRARARARGLDVRRSVEDLGDEVFDVVTFFHVLEHLRDPVGMLRGLRPRLAPGGLLLVEVPHARDALLETLDVEAFRAFTLWSEHLVLHTRQSLAAVLRAAGYSCDAVKGYQRYSLANHLYWLRHGRPGGHMVWSFLDNPQLAQGYAAALEAVDQTDTLVAYASVAK